MTIDFNKKELFAAPFTPMHPDGSLNTDIIPTYARFLVNNAVTGTFICGTTGEGPSLSVAEKKEIFTSWGQHRPSELKVIAMIGGNCIPEAQELAQHAVACNIDAVGIIAPYFFPLKNTRELVAYCAAIGEAIPDIPIYYYHIPNLSRAYFKMIDFLSMATHMIPNLVGIKFTHADLMDFLACLNYTEKRYHLLWGRDEVLISALAMGAHGAVGSTYNYMSPLFSKLIQAFEAGDLSSARELQQQANKIIKILLKYGGIAPGKTFMRIIGMDCGNFRLPVASIDPDIEALIKEELEMAGFFEVCSSLES